MIVVDSLQKSVPLGPTSIEILKDISFSVQEGDLVAIVGKSGSGKSTLMNILGLLDRPSAGTYKFEGREVAHLGDNEQSRLRNEMMGFVFQQYHLLPRFSVLENVSMPLYYRPKLSARDIRELSMTQLSRVGIADKAHHLPAQLSGGQQQRVAIARALAGRPRLILGDEPTGALDTNVGHEIMSLFLELNSQDKITVVIITHDEKVAQQCSRTLVMVDGQLKESKDLVAKVTT